MKTGDSIELLVMSDMERFLAVMGLDLTVQPPNVLYHYTSMQALLAIVASGRIRASHIRYLNDSSEVMWMWQAVVQQLERKKMSADTPEQAKLFAQLLDEVENRRHRGEFVASFSECGDDLSQWRAYCSTGPSFSIGFDAAALRTQWVSNPNGGEPFFVGGSLKKVQYLENEDTAKLEADLDAILELSPSITHGFHGPVSREDVVVAWLSVIAPNFKHAAFRAENEWRFGADEAPQTDARPEISSREIISNSIRGSNTKSRSPFKCAGEVHHQSRYHRAYTQPGTRKGGSRCSIPVVRAPGGGDRCIVDTLSAMVR